MKVQEDMRKDYENSREACKALPKIYLGQEVETDKGVGIVIGLDMPSNGLYLSPHVASVVVWFGMENAQRVVQSVFRPSEVKPFTRPEDSGWVPVSKALPTIPEGDQGISVLGACFDSVYDEACGGTGREGYEVHEVSYFGEDRGFQELWHGGDGSAEWGHTGDPVTHWMYKPQPPVRERIWEVSVGLAVENEEGEPGVVVKDGDMHNVEVDYKDGKGLYCLVKGCKDGQTEVGGALFKRDEQLS